MSALAMVLTAAMAVPGSGPEMVSAEMEQGFDLSGEWEIVWMSAYEKTGKGKVENGRLRASIAGSGPMNAGHFAFLSRTDFTDEGDGKLRVNWASGSACGIYQYRGTAFSSAGDCPAKGDQRISMPAKTRNSSSSTASSPASDRLRRARHRSKQILIAWPVCWSVGFGETSEPKRQAVNLHQTRPADGEEEQTHPAHEPSILRLAARYATRTTANPPLPVPIPKQRLIRRFMRDAYQRNRCLPSHRYCNLKGLGKTCVLPDALGQDVQVLSARQQMVLRSCSACEVRMEQKSFDVLRRLKLEEKVAHLPIVYQQFQRWQILEGNAGERAQFFRA